MKKKLSTGAGTLLFAISAWSPQSLPDGNSSHFLFGADSTDYLYSATSAGAFSSYNDIEARGTVASTGKTFAAKADGELIFTLGSQDPFNFEVHDLYVSTSPKLGPLSITVGRKTMPWNRLDEQWQLGVWQPRFVLDALQTEQSGLVGAFFEYNQPLFHFALLGSPGFIPERGSSMDFNNGQISSPSRWSSSPPSELPVLSSNTAANYALAPINLGQVVAHPGMSVMAKFGNEDSHTEFGNFWAQVGYAYKPMNQVLIGYDGKLVVDTLDIDLYPIVAYHHLGSLEFGFSGNNIGLYSSTLGEVPVQTAQPADWTLQTVTPSIATSATLEWIPSGRAALERGEGSRIAFSYLHQAGGNSPDVGPLAVSGPSLFGERYPFQDAIMIEAQARFGGGFSKRFLLRQKTTFDLGHNGLIFSPDLAFQATHSLMLGLGADILASGAAAGEGGFIQSYLANSRIRTGVSYVF